MSAGDVKIIGWSGGSASFKELAPSFTYEPIRQFDPTEVREDINYVNKRITRRIICFDYEKPQILQQLKFNDDNLLFLYVNNSGGTSTQPLGSGWELLTIDDSKYASGISQLTITYVKKVPIGFEFGLPTNLTIACNGNATEIRYKTTVLESIDPGLGSCGELGYNVKSLVTPEWQFFDVVKQNESPIIRFELTCGGVVVDSYELLGKEYWQRSPRGRGQRIIVVDEKFENFTPQEKSAAEASANAWIESQKLTEEAKETAIQSALSQYQNTEYISSSAQFGEIPYVNIWTNPFIGGWVYIAYYRAIINAYEYTNFPTDPTAKIKDPRLKAKWVQSGNIIRFEWAGKTIREYDVTGL